jgi:hypothetical protein
MIFGNLNLLKNKLLKIIIIICCKKEKKTRIECYTKSFQMFQGLFVNNCNARRKI